MKEDDDARADHYEEKVSGAIAEARSALIGSGRALWNLVPTWLQRLLEASFGLVFAYLMLRYIILPLLLALSGKH